MIGEWVYYPLDNKLHLVVSSEVMVLADKLTCACGCSFMLSMVSAHCSHVVPADARQCKACKEKEQ